MLSCVFRAWSRVGILSVSAITGAVVRPMCDREDRTGNSVAVFDLRQGSVDTSEVRIFKTSGSLCFCNSRS
jgi:hypothetical protein